MKNKQILNVKSILGFRRSKSKKTEHDLVTDVELKQKKKIRRERKIPSFVFWKTKLLKPASNKSVYSNVRLLRQDNLRIIPD
jgi:hypothetical protein